MMHRQLKQQHLPRASCRVPRATLAHIPADHACDAHLIGYHADRHAPQHTRTLAKQRKAARRIRTRHRLRHQHARRLKRRHHASVHGTSAACSCVANPPIIRETSVHALRKAVAL